MIVLIVGIGVLFSVIVDELVVVGEMLLICVLFGFELDVLGYLDWVGFWFEMLGMLIVMFKDCGVMWLCMVGVIWWFDVDLFLIDVVIVLLVFCIMQVLGQGDDGVLCVIIVLFEEVGIEVVVVYEIVLMLLLCSGV